MHKLTNCFEIVLLFKYYDIIQIFVTILQCPYLTPTVNPRFIPHINSDVTHFLNNTKCNRAILSDGTEGSQSTVTLMEYRKIRFMSLIFFVGTVISDRKKCYTAEKKILENGK